MVASGFFNEVPARDAVASLSHRRTANKCGAAILPFDSGTALGWKKTIVGWLPGTGARRNMAGSVLMGLPRPASGAE